MLRTTNDSTKSKHYVLYFDVNDTVFIGDSAKKVDKNLAILKMLAEKYISVWDPLVCNESLSYKEFVEKHLHKGDKRQPDIQKKHHEQFLTFIDYLTSINHSLLNEIKDKYASLNDKLQHGYLTNSFIKLLKYLTTNNYHHTIIFRTFGKDSKLLQEELSQRTSLSNLAQGTFAGGQLTLHSGTVLSSVEDILNHIKRDDHAIWQDCFADWQASGETHAGGKPYPIALDQPNVISIFFDDNVKKKILSVKLRSGNLFDQASLQQELIRLGRIVNVDTFSACEDDDYFITAFEYAKQFNSPLEKHLQLSQIGHSTLDEYIFAWAIGELCPWANISIARKCFAELTEAYHDPQRYFHRGLGHSRSLLPKISQQIYKAVLSQLKCEADLATAYLDFSSYFDKKLTDKASRIQEAQQILAAFYHDVVHRKGKKPAVLETFRGRDGRYYARQRLAPFTHALLNGSLATKPEELSCLVAEMHLRRTMSINANYLAPILLAIYATIPFAQSSHPQALRQRLNTMIQSCRLTFSSDDINNAITTAVAVANRDLGAYSEDTLDEFNQKSWAMMLERNPELANPKHTVATEAKTISEFYLFHKELYQKVLDTPCQIYHWLTENTTLQQLNNNAKQKLAMDIKLQGLLLGSLTIMMGIISRGKSGSIDDPINTVVNNVDVQHFLHLYESQQTIQRINEVPLEVLQVLMKHGQECFVNGISFIRGTSNAALAIRLVNLIGLDAMLKVADNYQNYATIKLDEIFNQLPALQSTKIDTLNQSKHVREGLQEFGSFKRARLTPENADNAIKVQPTPTSPVIT